MDSYDVTFLADEDTRKKYDSLLDADLKNAHSDTQELLPVPATFIIDTNGKIIYKHFDEDYKNRASVHEILNNLP